MNDVLGLMMTGIAVEAAMATTAEIHDLMTAYKKNNIDVVPIAELEKAFHNGLRKANEKGSLTSHLVEKMMKGEMNA